MPIFLLGEGVLLTAGINLRDSLKTSSSYERTWLSQGLRAVESIVNSVGRKLCVEGSHCTGKNVCCLGEVAFHAPELLWSAGEAGPRGCPYTLFLALHRNPLAGTVPWRSDRLHWKFNKRAFFNGILNLSISTLSGESLASMASEALGKAQAGLQPRVGATREVQGRVP